VAERLLFGVETERFNVALGRSSKADPGDVARATLATIAACRPHLADLNGSGVFLTTGGRFYSDCAHVEDCTPECSRPEEVVAYVKAAERVLLEAALGAAPELGAARITFGRSNVDYLTGATWGQHESFLCRNPPDHYAKALVAHLVSRVVYTGAGGLRPESNGLQFVVSPRMLLFTTVSSADSTHDRPILNLRDEPHASGWSRLHIIAGETLGSELALYLKVGVTALIVRLAELMETSAWNHLQLEHPVDALHSVAADTSCRQTIALRDGRRRTAIEIQRAYLDLAGARLHQLPEWAGEVCRRWASTLDALTGGPEEMSNALDWAIKMRIYAPLLRNADALSGGADLVGRIDAALKQTALRHRSHVPPPMLLLPSSPVLEIMATLNEDIEKRNLRWDRVSPRSPESVKLMEVDTQFGFIGEGIFDRLDRQGLLRHKIVSDEQIQRAMHAPPPETRARLRGKLVSELAGQQGCCCGWTIVLDPEKSRAVDLSDPWAHESAWLTHDGDEDPDSNVLGQQELLRL
jgi:hypothetical protein